MTDIITEARSHIGQFHDGPDVPMLARAIGSTFPDLKNYCSEAGNSTAWCGIFVAYILSKFGIRPPGVKNGVGFMWVDRWTDFGSPVPIGQEQPGDIAIFLGHPSPHHVTFVAGGGKYIGGNQSDGVTQTTFRTPDVIRRAPSGNTLPAQPKSAPSVVYSNITATMFGGNSDPNTSAYDNHRVTDTELGVALPYRFQGSRPQVKVSKGSKSVVCNIVDVGPWNTNDPYWLHNDRPQAESGLDTRGRATNLAGIDLTPAAAKAIDLNGKGLVNWEFIEPSTGGAAATAGGVGTAIATGAAALGAHSAYVVAIIAITIVIGLVIYGWRGK